MKDYNDIEAFHDRRQDEMDRASDAYDQKFSEIYEDFHYNLDLVRYENEDIAKYLEEIFDELEGGDLELLRNVDHVAYYIATMHRKLRQIKRRATLI